MNDAEKNRREIREGLLKKFTERVARALAARDCAQVGKEIPEEDHELWGVWNGGAEAAVTAMLPELEAFFEYDTTINWMTTCTGCARILDSAYQETMRRELGELTLKEIAEWAHTSRHGHAAGEVLNILEKGEKRQERTLRGEGREPVAGGTD
ncbi:MAG: hypothetical protein IJI97_06595 [Clostridia bacterium]|nr:hypothetical protein [Clostridia bacterium]